MKMSNLKEVRWKQRFENYKKSYDLLEKYVDQSTYTELEQAGLIQIFEMSFELSWKVIKDYLESEGYEISSPREAIKKAFEIGLIQDGEVWLEALVSRNTSVHTYDKSKIEALVDVVKEEYYPLLKSLKEALEERE